MTDGAAPNKQKEPQGMTYTRKRREEGAHASPEELGAGRCSLRGGGKEGGKRGKLSPAQRRRGQDRDGKKREQ